MDEKESIKETFGHDRKQTTWIYQRYCQGSVTKLRLTTIIVNTHIHTFIKKNKKSGCKIQAEKDLTVQTASGILHVLNLAYLSLGSNV